MFDFCSDRLFQEFFKLQVHFMAHFLWYAKSSHCMIQCRLLQSLHSPDTSVTRDIIQKQSRVHEKWKQPQEQLDLFLGKPLLERRGPFLSMLKMNSGCGKNPTHSSLSKMAGDLIGSPATQTISDMREGTGREDPRREYPLRHRPLHSDRPDLGSGY